MKPLFTFCAMIIYTLSYAQPPYAGTIFINPDIITSSSPSAIQSTTYTGQDTVRMYDRRVDQWVKVNAYLFDVVWDDGITSRAQVNPEFATIEAATTQAEKYAFLIGQLPTVLRKDVNEIWIHKGDELFGGGNNSILIHTGQSKDYEKDGVIEETLVHEASHTSLDIEHSASTGWIEAQNLDKEFISNYSRSHPSREDIAESFLTWLMVRYRKDKISVEDFNKITKSIPNRLRYFDSLNVNLYPFEEVLSISNFDIESVKIYPNPASDFIQIDGNNLKKEDITIFNLLGQDLTNSTSYENHKLDITKIPTGYYFLKTKTLVNKIYIE